MDLKQFKPKEVFMYVLAVIIIAGMVLITVQLIEKETLRDSLNLVIGTWLTAFGTVVGYFFGSSKGSSDKNEIIAKREKK